MNNVNIVLTVGSAQVPVKGTPDSAAYDLIATGHMTLIRGDKPLTMNLHIKTEFDRRYGAMIIPRSGLGSRGVYIANTVGLIDSDYRGEWKIKMGLDRWADNSIIKFQPGDKIAQVIFIPVADVAFTPVEDLSKTHRGAGGHGSTGR